MPLPIWRCKNAAQKINVVCSFPPSIQWDGNRVQEEEGGRRAVAAAFDSTAKKFKKRLKNCLLSSAYIWHWKRPGSHHLAKKVVASTASNCSQKWLHVTPPAVSQQPLRPKVAVSDSNGITLGSHMGSQTIRDALHKLVGRHGCGNVLTS